MKTLSVIMPVYNEKHTLREILKRVGAVKLDNLNKEIILVDDCSTDGTRDMLKEFESKYKIFYQDKNQGKGAAVIRGMKEAAGDFLIIQDADLEYNPEEYPRMVALLQSGRADAVIGSRFLGGESKRALQFWHYMGNRLLTFVSNVFTNIHLTDMASCYKAFTKEVRDRIAPVLVSERFGFDSEIVALLAQNKFRVYEVGISYNGRTYAEGKKIGWKDALPVMYATIKHSPPARIIKFLFSGGVATISNLVLLYAFTEYFHIWYIASSIIATGISIFVSFGLQKFLTFNDNDHSKTKWQLPAYAVLCIINLIINTGLVFIFVEDFHLWYILAQIISSALIAVETYFVFKLFIFKK